MSYRGMHRLHTVSTLGAVGGFVFTLIGVTLLIGVVVPVLGFFVGPVVGFIAALVVAAPLVAVMNVSEKRCLALLRAAVEHSMCPWCDAPNIRRHDRRDCWRCDRCGSAFKHDGTRFVPKEDW